MLTVTTAAENFNLIDVADAKAALDIVDNIQDEAVTAYIDRASDVIARHCRRVFALETVSEQFRLACPQDDLVLSRYPVVEITSIVENGVTLDDEEDYEFNAETGIVTRLVGDAPAWFPRGKLTIVYSSGFTLPADAPDALKQAAVQLVKAYALGVDRDPMLRSEGVENISSASYATDYLPADVRGLLRQFRNLRMR